MSSASPTLKSLGQVGPELLAVGVLLLLQAAATIANRTTGTATLRNHFDMLPPCAHSPAGCREDPTDCAVARCPPSNARPVGDYALRKGVGWDPMRARCCKSCAERSTRPPSTPGRASPLSRRP